MHETQFFSERSRAFTLLLIYLNSIHTHITYKVLNKILFRSGPKTPFTLIMVSRHNSLHWFFVFLTHLEEKQQLISF